MTHAMVITAVHLDEKTGKPIRYRVENSWSDAAGQKGFMVMTDAWFEQYVSFFSLTLPSSLHLTLVSISSFLRLSYDASPELTSPLLASGLLVLHRFVYQVVIHKNLADADLLEVLKKKPVILDAWDPLGALA